MLLRELFRISMGSEKMDSYLRGVRGKVSKLSAIGLKLEDNIKLAIILNGLPERYRYFIVSLEKQEKIDFDELAARLLGEGKNVDREAKIGGTALLSKTEGDCHYRVQKGHWKRDCRVREYHEEKGHEDRKRNARVVT
jgi:gag-polypeptide of LTR copia-type